MRQGREDRRDRLATGVRRLPLHHFTIHIPWHDEDWNGTVCARSLDSSICLGDRQGRFAFRDWIAAQVLEQEVAAPAPSTPRRRRSQYPANSATGTHAAAAIQGSG